jgi:hypothetical protein
LAVAVVAKLLLVFVNFFRQTAAAVAAVVIHFHFLVVQFFALVLVVLNFQVFADDL